jgi:hypothetical protein
LPTQKFAPASQVGSSDREHGTEMGYSSSMQSQNTSVQRDDGWIGMLVGVGLLILYIMTGPPSSYALVILAYAFITVVTVLSNWSKEFFWSMTVSAVIAFALWQLVLLLIPA